MEQKLKQLQTEATHCKFDALYEEIRLLKIEVQTLRRDVVEAITDKAIMVYERATATHDTTPPKLSDTSLPAPVVEELPQIGTPNSENNEIASEMIKPISTQDPIWTRSPEDVTTREYTSFYKQIVNDEEAPLAIKHLSLRPALPVTALLYVPKDFQSQKVNPIQMYVDSTFATDQCREFLPTDWTFIAGVIACDEVNIDPPKLFEQIKKHLVKQCLEMFAEIASKRVDLADAMNKVIEEAKKHEDRSDESEILPLAPDLPILANELPHHPSSTFEPT